MVPPVGMHTHACNPPCGWETMGKWSISLTNLSVSKGEGVHEAFSVAQRWPLRFRTAGGHQAWRL